jgi:hypothetical protein
VAMDDPLGKHEKKSIISQHQTKIAALREKQTDDDRLVLISRLKYLDALDIYLKYDGKVNDIPDYLTVYVWRIHEAFESYIKYLSEKYN